MKKKKISLHNGVIYEKTAIPVPENLEADMKIPKRQRRKFSELAPQQCRWPVGDPQSKEFFFCGAEVALLRPYCENHCKRAYNWRP